MQSNSITINRTSLTKLLFINNSSCGKHRVTIQTESLWQYCARHRSDRPTAIGFLFLFVGHTAHVISSGITPEWLRCPVTIRSESQATGVAYHKLLVLRSLANCFTFRWSLTTARRDGASLVNQMSTRSAARTPNSSNGPILVQSP